MSKNASGPNIFLKKEQIFCGATWKCVTFTLG
jgi:hypothetical protein